MMYCVILAIIVITIQQLGHGSDTMLPSESISVGQTLISSSQIFELGFFRPINSTRRYLGIWFKSTPETIVWVANRENGVSGSDESARLILSDDGNLEILDGSQNPVWSTNVSIQLRSPAMVLNDSGNLIIKDNISGVVAWESIAHPSDVYLLTTQFEFLVNGKLSQNLSWIAWKSENDPAHGIFSAGFLPQFPVQGYIWKGSNVHWRTGPWNGLRFVGIARTRYHYFDWSIVQNLETGIMRFSFNHYDSNIIKYMKIFHDGTLHEIQRQGDKWNVIWEAIRNPCDIYGLCGSFGVCNANDYPICSCSIGFVPKSVENWSKGNRTDGCVRRTRLLCSRNMSSNIEDGFWKMGRMKLPDHYRFVASPDNQECQKECLKSCSCSAYAFVDGIGCLVWADDLIDMQEFSFSGEDLFIRLHHFEIVGSKKGKIFIFLFIIILCSLMTVAVVKVKCKQHSKNPTVQQLLKGKSIRQDELTTFEFKDIVKATNGFSLSNKIGEGGFGAVFKGKLDDEQEIAVKRLSGLSGQGINEFLNEVLLISKLQHRNLVKLLGCSIEGEEKLIVYEYLPNGSLDSFLFDSSKKQKLDWATRFNIIQEIAKGISYLHRDSRLKVIHRDLKASNVLLDEDMNPKISDFGLARTFESTQESANTSRVVGTYGYMSPEYALRGIFSEKSDVFSFGVLVLEIISGKKMSSRFDSSALGLLSHAWKLWNEVRELELIDQSLVDFSSDQVKRCIRIGLLCVQDRVDERPNMPTVILMLNGYIISLPQPKPFVLCRNCVVCASRDVLDV